MRQKWHVKLIHSHYRSCSKLLLLAAILFSKHTITSVRTIRNISTLMLPGLHGHMQLAQKMSSSLSLLYTNGFRWPWQKENARVQVKRPARSSSEAAAPNPLAWPCSIQLMFHSQPTKHQGAPRWYPICCNMCIGMCCSRFVRASHRKTWYVHAQSLRNLRGTYDLAA